MSPQFCCLRYMQAEIDKLNTEAQRRVRELKARIERVKKAGDDDDDVVDDEEALAAEVAQLQGEIEDRRSVVEGTSESVRVDIGGRRIIKQKNNINDIVFYNN